MDEIKKKTIGRIFYTISSFVHHFKSIGEFKLELQSETLHSGQNWVNFLSRMALNLMVDFEK